MHVSHPPLWTHDVVLHGAGGLLAALILAWLLLAEPLLGLRSFRDFLRALQGGDTHARTRFYRRWIVQSWVLMVLLLGLSIYGFGWTPAQLGLRMPQLRQSWPWAFLGGLVLSLCCGALIGAMLARRHRKSSVDAVSKPARHSAAEVLNMLPRTPAERGWFTVLAVTAGITEEVIWRGLLLALLVATIPGLPMYAQALALSVAFGWAHLYQGVRGMLGTAILGGVLTALYLTTGSLLLPVIVHVLIDLAAMLQTPRPKRTPTHDHPVA
jgi:membrane protease YdiL (CAAX protease family)